MVLLASLLSGWQRLSPIDSCDLSEIRVPFSFCFHLLFAGRPFPSLFISSTFDSRLRPALASPTGGFCSPRFVPTLLSSLLSTGLLPPRVRLLYPVTSPGPLLPPDPPVTESSRVPVLPSLVWTAALRVPVLFCRCLLVWPCAMCPVRCANRIRAARSVPSHKPSSSPRD